MAALIIGGGSRDFKTFEIDKPVTVVGRSGEADVRVDNLGVSGKHFQIELQDGKYLLRDLGSKNKTFVNGAEVKEHLLKDGDKIVVSSLMIVFSNPVKGAQPAPPPSSDGEFNEPTMVMDAKAQGLKVQALMSNEGKPMTAAQYGQAYAPPEESSPEEKKKVKLVTVLVIVAIVAVWAIGIAIFLARK